MDYALILVIAFSTIFFFGAQSAKFTFTNNCHYTVWPATLTGGGGAQVSPTGFELSPKASYSLNIPSPWSGRLWGRTFCSTDHAGKFTCATGDCGSGQISCAGAGAIPPASLVEFTLAPNNGEDFYDISLVDGFNLPVSVTPSASSGTAGTCRTASCPADLNRHCPRRLAVKAKSGVKIGCKSACLAFNTPEYCCTGEYGTPQTCRPTRFSEYFKSRCDQAYSYAYDDKTSTFTCSGGPNYHITFCP